MSAVNPYSYRLVAGAIVVITVVGVLRFWRLPPAGPWEMQGAARMLWAGCGGMWQAKN